MKERTEVVFTTIIKEYIKTASPISSQHILRITNIDVSSATIRSIMVDLEKQGLIIQPHTSAGRVPTQAGYELYIAQHLSDTTISSRFKDACEGSHQNYQENPKLRQVAKEIAKESNLFVFVACEPSNIYYTGLSQLLSQPEFSTYDMYYDLSKVIDRMDEIIYSIFKNIENTVETFIGDQNPIGSDCSVIISRYVCGDQVSLIGLVGPMRMDYDSNIALMEYAHKQFIYINK